MHGREVVVMKKMLAALLVLFMVCAFPVCAETNNYSDSIVLISDTETTWELNKDQIYSFSVKEDNNYFVEITYCANNTGTVTPQVMVDYDDLKINKVVDMPRLWKNKFSGNRFDTDEFGNECLPKQEEVIDFQTIQLQLGNNNNIVTNNAINISNGNHSIKFTMQKESIIVRQVRLIPSNGYISWKEYCKQNGKTGNSDNEYSKTLEAELTQYKSHPEIVVSYDRSSPEITPNDPSKIIYNIIGGSGYQLPGQWISWSVDVPADGYYCVDFKYRQNINEGQISHRQLLVDGKIPFAECSDIDFPYSEKFTEKVLKTSDGEETGVYLTKGTHEIKLLVIEGSVGKALLLLEKAVRDLNRIYTQIIRIVGETPDSYRDYDLDKHIVGLFDTLEEIATTIAEATKYFSDGNTNNSNTAQLNQVVRTLRQIIDNPRTVAVRQDSLFTQINTVSNLISSLSTQPLELDTITIHSLNYQGQTDKVGLWDKIAFRIKSFISSFTSDYTNDTNKKSINVWVTANGYDVFGFATGRDQAQIINQLSRNEFTTKTGISVNFSLMDSAVILKAFVSGKGPDAALFVPETVISNLYFRNALLDLKQMNNFSEIEDRYYQTAFTSLSYNGKVFALPEVQCYNMLFCRNDIFEEYNLKVPETWDDFYNVLKKLQKGGMQTSIGDTQLLYETFLLQNGGELYEDDLSSTKMTSEKSVTAFHEVTEFFTRWGVPVSADALNRFRTGQIPMLISTAYFYNSLTISATEIEGLWSMYPIPATVNNDGSLNRSESGKVSGAIAFKSSKNVDETFDFLNWWTSDEVQNEFAFECESRIGKGSRYFPANKNVLKTMSWSEEEYVALSSQREVLKHFQQSPATYYLNRNFVNAFRRVVYDYENSRDVIYRYGRETDNELHRKMKELKLTKEYDKQ